MKIDTIPGQPERFSTEFDALIGGGKKVKHFLKGSDIVVPWIKSDAYVWEWWKKGRKPVAEIIDALAGADAKTLTVLDVGSANGFLLRCLQEWSTHEIDPYGIDDNARRVKEARALFPDHKDHFVTSKESTALPEGYDFVYWNVWDNYTFKPKDELEFFERLLGKSGKLVLGFYDTKPLVRYAKIQRLRELGYTPLGVRSADNETFAWFEGTKKA